MLETGRRSAISTSELGLYSDRGDRYSRSRYGLIARKLAIGVMVVVTVILVSGERISFPNKYPSQLCDFLQVIFSYF